ncbi:MAG TPA: SAM-dependent methyltransferase [Burkholderiaceae bacterium]|nr:SAM-dependent methyltransferase [Burkholderiaceae bacterium]
MTALHLVPVPIVEGKNAGSVDGSAMRVLPPATIDVARQARYFLVENARSARAFLKAVAHPQPISSLRIVQIDRQADVETIDNWLMPVLAVGDTAAMDAVLLSEAGCPGIADPGAALVARAHELGIRVMPWVGPSSIVLALMGAGMNGQQFRFLGYLPQARDALRDRLRIVQRDAQLGETQIFIETPYRNGRLFEEILDVCDANIRLGLAIELTGANQSVATYPIARWRTLRAATLPTLQRRPAVFLLRASTAALANPRVLLREQARY